MLILRQSRKDSTLQKSPCYRNSEIFRLTQEIADLRNENRTKNCIIQTLLENANTQQKPPVPNKSDFKVPNESVQSSESHSANNSCISTSNRYRELSNNGDIENENNNGDYEKPTKVVDSNKTNSGKKNNYDTRKKSTNQ